ncbi:cyclase [Synechococcales cyanobacterium C]|uniref:Cyclase n=2 Tax=Petrachloros TaxID=2918834 RepID=A0A8K1ZW41_9CYAN|nr:SRPBCC family protein [Petrachloros mirabilis]NCJ06315.1 cyclase [Petrachloros mirabilis ULC683]
METAVTQPPPSAPLILSRQDLTALLQGEILVEGRSYQLCGGAAQARMYLPVVRSQVWTHLTNYSRWVQYFPDIVQSDLLERNIQRSPQGHRLYQVARRTFFLFSAQVEVYLRVFETIQQQIQFRFEQGSFKDFAADLTLKAYGKGTVLTYTVRAIPNIPVPGVWVQQAIRQDLPNNMRQMRQVICQTV